MEENKKDVSKGDLIIVTLLYVVVIIIFVLLIYNINEQKKIVKDNLSNISDNENTNNDSQGNYYIEEKYIESEVIYEN